MQNFYDLDNDVLDLRDVLERIADLELQIGTDEEIDSDQDELADLNGFVQAIQENFSDSIESIAVNEPTIINGSYWVQYAQELAEDLGLIEDTLEWPACHIDWDAAAASLDMDYIRFDYKGAEYLIRGY